MLPDANVVRRQQAPERRSARNVLPWEEGSVGDIHTRRLDAEPTGRTFEDFLSGHRAALVVLSGVAAGSEFSLDRPKLSMGRGPGVDLAFDDTAMSREHGVLEFSGGEFRIRDLGSTNGIQLNDKPVKSGNLEHGDRVRMGEHVFQFVLEAVTPEPKTYVLTDD